jgi:RimJ/RimL family protein N-acetyltransferase
MAKKKHRKHPNRPSKTLKREARLAKAKQWLPTYEGTKIVKAYRKRFCVDTAAAVRDLLELGYEFAPGYVDNLLKSEAARQEQLCAQKEARREQESYNLDQDDRFFYIAGHTSGGAPYGVTWEDMARERIRADRKKLPSVPTLYSELADEQKAEALTRLKELVDDCLEYAEYLPDDKDRDEIIARLCDELTESLDECALPPYEDFDRDELNVYFSGLDDNGEAEDGDLSDEDDETDRPEILPYKEIIPDDALKSEYDRIVAEYVAELKADGVELPTFVDSLIVAKTERLKIRRFYGKDFSALFAIMKNPEVMYAWEAAFTKGEVRKWLNQQLKRYRKDGCGYFAVTLRDSGRLIGQAGFMKSAVNGEDVTEIGYIFDNTFWGRGYAAEAARACVDLAFGEFGLDRLYATIRPGNSASVRLAEKLGMRKIGEYVKTYKDKEMPHDIYAIDNPQAYPRQ